MTSHRVDAVVTAAAGPAAAAPGPGAAPVAAGAPDPAPGDRTPAPAEVGPPAGDAAASSGAADPGVVPAPAAVGLGGAAAPGGAVVVGGGGASGGGLAGVEEAVGAGAGVADPGGPVVAGGRGRADSVVPVAVDVVLPCLDEAGALPWVLARIPAGWRALVVDNGSRDGSPEIARSLGAVVVHEPRRGYGAACHAGLRAATADIVCFCDCDASLDPGLLTGFVRAVADGEADLVLGRRRPAVRAAWPAHARAANLALSALLHRRTGLRLHDLGPLRAARREPLLALDLTDRRSGYPLQTVVRAADAGWRVRERDVPYLPREGRSKVTGTWRGTWHAIRDMRRVLAEPPYEPGAPFPRQAAPPAATRADGPGGAPQTRGSALAHPPAGGTAAGAMPGARGALPAGAGTAGVEGGGR